MGFLVDAVRSAFGEPARSDLGARGERLDPRDILDLARRHSVTPIADRGLRAAGAGDTPAGTAVHERARELGLRGLARAGALVEVLGALERVGVPALAHKGPVLAVTLYGDVAAREFVDLDVLVRPRDVGKALDALEALGARDPVGLPPWQRERLPRASYEWGLVHPVWGIVELQWALAPPAFGSRLGVGQMLPRSIEVGVGGRNVRTLSAEDTFLAIAVHGCKHRFERLGWVVDLLGLIRAVPDLDWTALRDRARAAHAGRMLAVSLSMITAVLDAELPAAARAIAERDDDARGLAEDLGRLLMADALGPRPGEPPIRREHLRMLDSSIDRVAYLARLATMTTVNDWAAVRLPERAAFLYPVIRPIRLAGRSVARRIRRA